MGLAGAAKIGPPAAHRCVVRGTEILRALDQLVVDRALLPIQLIDRPGRDARFLQRANVRRGGAGPLRQRVALGGELVEGKLVEMIDVGVETRGAHDGWIPAASPAESPTWSSDGESDGGRAAAP